MTWEMERRGPNAQLLLRGCLLLSHPPCPRSWESRLLGHVFCQGHIQAITDVNVAFIELIEFGMQPKKYPII